MSKIIPAFWLCIFLFSGCVPSPSTVLPTPLVKSETLVPVAMPAATGTHALPTLPPTVSPEMIERPVFLAWPLPAHIGIARISQFPNSAWSWNYLGLNPGYECPPMFGYLLNIDSWPYWRDISVPEEQDMNQADPHNFEMVACYSSGGGGARDGHEGTDFKAPAGTLVLAAADGLVMEWRLSGLNSMIVLKHCLFGTWDENYVCVDGWPWYTTYMHLVPTAELLQENLAVAQGTILGEIYDQTINSHLHFEVGLEKRGYANFINPWGQDVEPWLGCLWLDQSLCVSPEPSFQRLAIYFGGQLILQQGDGSVRILDGAQDIGKIRLWGERIGLLDSRGDLFLWEGKILENVDEVPGWQMVAGEVLDFQISNKRIAILNRSGDLLVSEENKPCQWTYQAGGVKSFSLADTRLGYLNDEGDLFVKQGGLETEWLFLKDNVRAFQLIDNRIAFLDRQGNLFVNEGDLLAEYQQMAGDVRIFQVTNRRIGIIDANGILKVKEGNLRAEWLNLAFDVQNFQLADARILMLGVNGFYHYKEGNLYQEWRTLPYTEGSGLLLNGGISVISDHTK